MNNGINEHVINFDSLNENGDFIKEEENVINNRDNIIKISFTKVAGF